MDANAAKEVLCLPEIEEGTEFSCDLGSFFAHVSPSETFATVTHVVDALLSRAYWAGNELRPSILRMVRIIDHQPLIPAFLGRDGDLLLDAYRAFGRRHTRSAFLLEGIRRRTTEEATALILRRCRYSPQTHLLIDTGFAGSIFDKIAKAAGSRVSGLLLSSEDGCKYRSCGADDLRDAIMAVEHAPRPIGYRDNVLTRVDGRPFHEDVWQQYRRAWLQGLRSPKRRSTRFFRRCAACEKPHYLHELNVWSLCRACAEKARYASHIQCEGQFCGDRIPETTAVVVWVATPDGWQPQAHCRTCARYARGCPKGHRWVDAFGTLTCPVCAAGEAAEVIQLPFLVVRFPAFAPRLKQILAMHATDPARTLLRLEQLLAGVVPAWERLTDRERWVWHTDSKQFRTETDVAADLKGTLLVELYYSDIPAFGAIARSTSSDQLTPGYVLEQVRQLLANS